MKPKPAKTLQQHLLFLIMKNESNQKTKTKPLFPKYTMHWEEEDQTHYLEFDGLRKGPDDAPYPSDLVLTDIGAIQLKYALCNLPIHKTNGNFWGYKDQPDDENLWNCEPPAEDDVLVQLSSKNEAALLAVAKHLSDTRCWKISSYE